MMGALGAQSSLDSEPKKEAKEAKREAPKPPKTKETMTEDEAATLIQSRFRGHLTRLEWGPALEERLKKLVEKHIDNAEEASKALEDLGRYTNSKKMTSLIMFSEKVHMSNQETHKYLRRHKAGIRLEEVKAPPKDYKRPKGFDHIPQPISANRPVIKITSTDEKISEYYDFLQEEMRSPTPDFNPDTPWDAPLASKIQRPSRPRAAEGTDAKVDLRQEKMKAVKEGLVTQNMENQEKSEEHLVKWKGAVAFGAGVPPPEMVPKG
ncbi:putative myosin-IIIa-like [Penaeus vannamei]|uniref:Putative myosin-IIIa-like n=1 Tax=Penaeus vannamei TaxID=6689 RepID=A0A3R7MZU4_PENVA|nr:putative myosin-IIIa-like [Penaeus vannamei]